MSESHDILFRTLADPTRRAIFERLCREGEQTVGALTARAKVSQPAVSKHLGVLKQAGLVRDRHEGRQTHYSAQLGALGAADRLDQPDDRLLAKPVRQPRRSAQKDGPMSEAATETLSVVVEREIPYPPEKIWRALTQPHLIAEWLMQNDFEPVVGPSFQSSRRLGRVDCEVLAVEPNRTLSYTWAATMRVIESVVTLTLTPTGTGTHLRMEQSGFRPDQKQAYGGAKAGLAEVFREAGAGTGADRLKPICLYWSDNNREEDGNGQEKTGAKEGSEISLPADRCENQGTGRLAGRDARPGPRLIKEAYPDVVEEWKWRGVPVWEHDGIICTGETYKAVVKLTFANGAALEDPSGLFNSSLEGKCQARHRFP